MQLHLIFDLDGTIIDSANDFHKSLEELLAMHGAANISFEQARSYIGSGFRGFVESIHENPTSHLRRQVYNDFLAIYEKKFLCSTNPYEGVVDFILNSPHQISLCTNKPEKYAYKSLEHFGLLKREWTGLIYGDSFSSPKPHPQGIEHLLHLSETPRERTIFIGDGLPDVLAAKNAGLPFIGIEFGYYPSDKLSYWGADFILDHYKNLNSLLENYKSA